MVSLNVSLPPAFLLTANSVSSILELYGDCAPCFYAARRFAKKSGGSHTDKERVDIARSLAMILADEPTGNLNAQTGIETRRGDARRKNSTDRALSFGSVPQQT